MKITKQDGTVAYCHGIEMQGCKIFCVPDEYLSKNRELCGQYVDLLRTAEVFAEMAYAGWHFENSEYIMPNH